MPTVTLARTATLALGASSLLIIAAAIKPGPRAGAETADMSAAGELNAISEARALLTTNLSCANLTNLLLAELHLSPEILAAVECSDDQVRAIVGAAKALCESGTGSFDAAQAEYEHALGEVHRLEHLALTGRITPDERKELRRARADLDDARNNRETVFHQVRDVIRASVSQEQVEKLAAIAAARHIEVPLHHKLSRKSDQELLVQREELAQQTFARQGTADNADTAAQAAANTPKILADAAGQAHEERTTQIAALWFDILGD